MSWLSSFLNPGRGYKAAQDQLSNYYNQAQGYMQPYNQFGQQQMGNLSGGINALLDPQALQDKWSSGYKESDAAKQMEGMASEHGLDAASSMGLMGSTPALQAIQAGTSGIVAQDKQKYLDDLMEKYKSGLGLSQGVFNQGASTAGQMGQNAMNMGSNAAQMAFGQQNAGGNMFSKLLEGLTSFGVPFAQAWGMNKLGLNSPWSTGGR